MYRFIWSSQEDVPTNIPETLYHISEDGYPNGSPWTQEMFNIDFLSPDTDYVFVFENNQIIGYAGLSYSFDTVDITNIVIRSVFKGNNIGKSLLENIFEMVRTKNKEGVFIEVRESAVHLIKWYENNGFAKLSIRKKYYHQPIENAQIMHYNF